MSISASRTVALLTTRVPESFPFSSFQTPLIGRPVCFILCILLWISSHSSRVSFGFISVVEVCLLASGIFIASDSMEGHGLAEKRNCWEYQKQTRNTIYTVYVTDSEHLLPQPVSRLFICVQLHIQEMTSKCWTVAKAYKLYQRCPVQSGNELTCRSCLMYKGRSVKAAT